MEHKYGPQLQYDVNWKGPLKTRSCTDTVWLIIFLAVVITWCGTGYYAVTNGSIGRLLAPTDSTGRKCGYDVGVTDKQYLVFFDITKCLSVERRCNTPQVCVERCPQEDFTFNIDSPLEELRTRMICEYDIQLLKATKQQLKTYVDEDKCAGSYFKSIPFVSRCIPDRISNNRSNTVVASEDVLQQASEVIKSSSSVLMAFNDIQNARYIILAGNLASILASISYIIILQWMATQIVIVNAVIIFCFLASGVYVSNKIYMENGTSGLLMLITFSIALVIYTLVVLFLHKRIYLSCQIIKEGSRAVTQILSSLVVPLFPHVLQMLLVVSTLLIQVLLLSLSTQYEEEDRKSMIIYLHIINIIAAIWILVFIEAVGHLTLAGVFCIWYWTFRKSDVPFFTVTVSFWRTVRYHLGTAAIGSLIIMLFSVIRFIYITLTTLVKSRFRSITRFLEIITCCCSWVERLIKLVNRNAYVICATYGSGFCPSAKTAYNLIMRNILRLVVINKIISWLMLEARIVICVLTTFATGWYCYKIEDITNFWLPTILVLLGSFGTTGLFFSVHQIAIEAIFLCFLEDCERNDGSPRRPYYMSKRLGRLLLHR